MYFKINAPQKDKYIDMGMVNISASFYLEKGDEGWDKYQAEHHVTVSIITEHYQGKVDEEGSPVDQEDYNKWIASLPTQERDNPFCNHSMQFEANATEEEILWCFEFALAQTHLNYLEDDLHCEKGTTAKVVNQDIGYLGRKLFYANAKGNPTVMDRVASAETKCLTLKEVDFTAVETIASYSVRK
jgi:hypothetical protein